MFEGILQPTHLLLIFAIALLVFGPQKLPQLGKGLGEAIRGFRDGLRPPDKQVEGGTPQNALPPAKDDSNRVS